MSARVRKLVVDELSFVFAQLHFDDAVVELLAYSFDFGERVFGLLFVLDVNFGHTLAGFDESAEDINIFPQ